MGCCKTCALCSAILVATFAVLAKMSGMIKLGPFNLPPDDPTPAQVEARGNRWVRSADGRNRLIEYRVHGSDRPDARISVTMYASGVNIPGVKGPFAGVYEDLNVREISVSLPGFGWSTIQPGRQVENWPHDDLEPILQAEGVDKFVVYGASLGTIHSLSVAAYFGPERVERFGLRAPLVTTKMTKELGLPHHSCPLGPLVTNKDLEDGTLYAYYIRACYYLVSLLPVEKMLAPEFGLYVTKQKELRGSLFTGYYRELSMTYEMSAELLGSGFDARDIKVKGPDKVIIWCVPLLRLCLEDHSCTSSVCWYGVVG